VLKAAALYLGLTILLAWPLALAPARGAMPGDPDTDLFIWNLAWNTHALTTDPLSVFDANIYHPHPKTLAFSENLIGSTLIAAPVHWITGDPLLALNVVALSSIVLSALGAFLLARRLGLGMAAALVCGMVFAFSPARFFRLGQIHLATIHWVPFCLAFLHTYLERGRPRDLRIAIAFFTLQAFTSGHGAVFLVVAIGCVLLYRLALGEPIAMARRLRDVGIPGALAAAPLALLALPYRFVQEEFGLKRTLDGWETPASSFFASLTPVHNWIFDVLNVSFSEEPTANLFPGFLPIALALAALFIRSTSRVSPRTSGVSARTSRASSHLALALSLLALAGIAIALYVHLAGPVRLRVGDTLIASARDPWRAWFLAALAAAGRIALLRRVPLDLRRRASTAAAGWRTLSEHHRTDARPAYIILTLLAILLSMGPPLGLWPLVYWIPGFNFLRVPSRFMLLAVLGMGVLAAFAFAHLTRRLGSRGRALALVAVTIILVVECYTVPLPGYRPYDVEIPEADRWLATQPRPLVVAELPTDYHNERRQSTYMLHSMAHWGKTIHGHSGIRTPYHHELYEKLRGFPSEASFDALAAAGVTHVVVHPQMYEPADWQRASSDLPAFADHWKQVYDDGASQVYILRIPYGSVGDPASTYR
jgi:hypothetical protein